MKTKNLLRFIFCTIVLSLLVSACDNPDRYKLAEDKSRIYSLIELCDYVKFYTEHEPSPTSQISLFTIIKYAVKCGQKPPYSITLPQRDNDYFIADYLNSVDDFAKKCEYKMVNVDDEMWGILETVQGRWGKYYLLRLENGKVYRIYENKLLDIVAIKKGRYPLVKLKEMLKAKKANSSFPITIGLKRTKDGGIETDIPTQNQFHDR